MKLNIAKAPAIDPAAITRVSDLPRIAEANTTVAPNPRVTSLVPGPAHEVAARAGDERHRASARRFHH